MTPQEADELLGRVLKRATEIKAAGLQRFSLGEASFVFGPDDTPSDGGQDTGEDDVDPSVAALIAGKGKERPPL